MKTTLFCFAIAMFMTAGCHSSNPGQNSEQNPGEAAAHGNRGVDYSEKGQYDKAIEEFSQVIRLNPADSFAYYNRGIVYVKKSEPQKAIHDLNEAIRIKPDDAEAYCYRGIAHGQSGQYQKSVDDFQKAISLNNALASAYFGLATIRATCPDASMRNGLEAVNSATKTCELTAWKDAQSFDLLAAAYAESGNFDKAMESENQALKIGTDNPELHNQMLLRLTLFKNGLKFQNPTIFR